MSDEAELDMESLEMEMDSDLSSSGVLLMDELELLSIDKLVMCIALNFLNFYELNCILKFDRKISI